VERNIILQKWKHHRKVCEWRKDKTI